MKAAILILAPVILALGGCSNIRSKQPVGAEAIDLTQSIGDVELSALAGEWVKEDGESVSIKITDAAKGEILYEPSEKDEDQDEPLKLQLRRTDDHLFINFEADEDGERVWLLFAVQGNLSQIVYWQPDREKFRQLVAEGKIPGTNDPETKMNPEGEQVKNQNPGAVIDDPDGTWVGKMVAGEFGVVFDWKNPTVLRKKRGDDVPEAEPPARPAVETDGE